MIKLEVLKNKDLLISIVDKDEFLELLNREFNDERSYLLEMLESGRYLGNNWDTPLKIGLTEAPAIGYGIAYDDGGIIEDWDNLWIYSNYMLTSYLDELKNNGQVIFNKV